MPIFNLESCKYNARTLAWTIGVLFIVRDRSKLLSAGTGQVFVRSCLLQWRRNNENARSGRALGNQQSVTVLSKPLARYVSLSATVSLRLCPREPPRLRCTCSDHNLPINFLQLNSWRQTSITFARWVVDVPVCVWPNWTLQTYVLTTGYVAAIHRLAAGHADRVYRLFASLLRVPASPWPPAKKCVLARRIFLCRWGRRLRCRAQRFNQVELLLAVATYSCAVVRTVSHLSYARRSPLEKWFSFVIPGFDLFDLRVRNIRTIYKSMLLKRKRKILKC